MQVTTPLPEVPPPSSRAYLDTGEGILQLLFVGAENSTQVHRRISSIPPSLPHSHSWLQSREQCLGPSDSLGHFIWKKHWLITCPMFAPATRASRFELRKPAGHRDSCNLYTG